MNYVFGAVYCPTHQYIELVVSIRDAMNEQFDELIETCDANDDGIVDLREAITSIRGTGGIFKDIMKILKGVIKNVRRKD